MALENLVKPARASLPVVRADSLEIQVRLRDKTTKAPIVLTGYVGRSAIRPAIDNPAVTELTVVVSQDASGPNVGLVTVTATGEQTQVFPEVGVWDLQISDGSPTGIFRKTVVQGPLSFVRDVTPQG